MKNVPESEKELRDQLLALRRQFLEDDDLESDFLERINAALASGTLGLATFAKVTSIKYGIQAAYMHGKQMFETAADFEQSAEIWEELSQLLWEKGMEEYGQ